MDPRAFVATIEAVAAGRQVPTALDETRTFTTLAFVDELIEHPELLRAYADRFGPQDDASLILWTPGVGSARLLELAEQALAVAGLPDDRVPDVLLTPMPGAPEADAQLASAPTPCSARGPLPAASAAFAATGATTAKRSPPRRPNATHAPPPADRSSSRSMPANGSVGDDAIETTRRPPASATTIAIVSLPATVSAHAQSSISEVPGLGAIGSRPANSASSGA